MIWESRQENWGIGTSLGNIEIPRLKGKHHPTTPAFPAKKAKTNKENIQANSSQTEEVKEVIGCGPTPMKDLIRVGRVKRV